MPELIKHIAFIMDGNGRWATGRGLPRLEGHRQGVKALEKLLPALAEAGVECATFYAFSTENWRRSETEVGGLMDLLRWYFKNELKRLKKENVRISFIGDRREGGALPADVLKIMADVEADTRTADGLHVVFAINYGGQDEIERAARMAGEDGKIEENLDTAKLGLPPLDALVRTGGEKRLSNFLLWQAAYAELFFVDVLWPDFGVGELKEILEEFAGRQRKFGGVVEEKVAS